MGEKKELSQPSDTGGVPGMSIAGRMVSERERLLGMSEAERAWRAQWLKDQILAPEEPVYVYEYYKQRYNPLRRFYRAPLEAFQRKLTPTLGVDGARFCRTLISSSFFMLLGVWGAIYYFKYGQSDWTRKSGWKTSVSRPRMFPKDPGFPNYKEKTDREWVTYGFEKSPI